MAEDRFSDGVIVGLLIGVLVGIPLGWIVAQIFKPSQAAQAASSSVVFDRDEQGRITGIHYVPLKAGGGV